MSNYFERVIEFTDRLSLDIIEKNDPDEILVVNNEEKGIFHLVIDLEFPILIMEQLIYVMKKPSEHHFKRLLQMNRNLIHGAFVLDDDAKQMIFRDTLQLENLDFNEFEGTVNSLCLGLAECSKELISLNQE